MSMNAADEKWLINSFTKKNESFSTVANGRGFSIHAAPAYIREGYKDLFEPTVMSLGPKHRQSHPKSDDKSRYFHDLLRGVPNSSEVIPRLIQETNQVVEQAWNCYGCTGRPNRDFVEMMVLDGCFLIGFFFKYKSGGAPAEIAWNRHQIKADLLKLENQIPFLVLQKLYSALPPSLHALQSTTEYSLVDLALVYLSNGSYQRDPPWSLPNANRDIDHLLHLYQLWSVAPTPTPTPTPRPPQPAQNGHRSCFYLSSTAAASGNDPRTKCFGRISSLRARRLCGSCLPVRTRQQPSPSPSPPSEPIPTATGLTEAGVTMKKKSSSASLLHITFSRKSGSLEIPQLEIDPPQKAILANLFVFEQSRSDLSRHWTAYVKFVKNIIDTPKDIDILSEAGVIKNCLASAEELATFFNQLAPSGDLKSEDQDMYFGTVERDVNEYCKADRHRHCAKFKRDYFSSPWSIISLLAAIVLLLLTAVQTFFAVYAYVKPPQSSPSSPSS